MRKMKGVVKIILLLVFALFCISSAYGQGGHSATVKGKMIDWIDALVPNIQIVFTNDTRTYKVRTGENGEYQLALEPGKYKVSTEAYGGFSAIRRSEVLLESDAAKTLNLRVYPIRSLLVDVSDGATECISGYYYQEIAALSTVGMTDGMVRYGLNFKKGSLLTFDPFLKRDEQVIFTYDFFSVSADQIRVDTRKKEVYAIGNVTIELENKKEKYAGTVKVRFEKGKALYKKL